jgi:hypothetical protein
VPIDISKTEAVIAREARRLVDNLEHPPTAELLQALQSLFAVHQGGAFEAIVQPTIRVQNEQQLIIRGLLSWDGRVELFGAELTLAEGRDALLDYVLNFGRGDASDRKIPYDQRTRILPELRKAGEWSWAQTFRKR